MTPTPPRRWLFAVAALSSICPLAHAAKPNLPVSLSITGRAAIPPQVRTHAAREIARPLEYHIEPATALIVESVCLLDHAFSRAGRSAGELRDSADDRTNVDSPSSLAEISAEVLPLLRRITSTMPVTRHEFLSADGSVQRAVFGRGAEAVTAVINTGDGEIRYTSPLGGSVLLPLFGFVVEGTDFAVFHACRWVGVDYANPPLFTLRSLDGRPLACSQQVRIFHAFGDARLNVAGITRSISREAVIAPNYSAR